MTAAKTHTIGLAFSGARAHGEWSLGVQHVRPKKRRLAPWLRAGAIVLVLLHRVWKAVENIFRSDEN